MFKVVSIRTSAIPTSLSKTAYYPVLRSRSHKEPLHFGRAGVITLWGSCYDSYNSKQGWIIKNVTNSITVS
jgi:hypothetical protein